MEDWPLDKISEPHETNDILWHREKKKAAEVFLADSLEPSKDYPQCIGNQRFRQRLEECQEKYQSMTSISRPTVAVELLKKWRAEQPPGRFLVASGDSEQDTLLWKDVGNSRARSYISQTLKQMAAGRPCSIGSKESLTSDESTADTYPSSLEASSHEGVVTNDEGTKKAMDSPPPAPPLENFSVPRFQRPQKIIRRISEQLHAARSNGFLHGRWEERDRLASIFNAQIQKADNENQHKTGFVLIKGSMGVGRTALARTLMCPLLPDELIDNADAKIVEPSAFLEGKFEHLQSPNPYKIFRDIFTDFCNQLLRHKSSTLVEQYRIAISDALQDDVTALIGLVPALGSVLRVQKGSGADHGNPPDSVELNNKNGSEMQGSVYGNNLNGSGALFRRKVTSLFVKLIQAIASVEPDKPLVVFYDDLHWASETSLDIMFSLVSDVDVKASVLFVASVLDGHKCHANQHCDKMMERLDVNESIDMNVVELQNLKEKDVEHMLEDTFQCGQDKIQSLSSLVYSLTLGNPMFITNLLRSFQDEGLIRMDQTSEQWVCDVDMIHASFRGVNNVFDLFKKKVLDLPASVQSTLKQASCLGSSQIDESIMKLLSSSDGDLASHLKSAVQVRLLRREKNNSYYFVSDGVQHAIYDLIPCEERAKRHLEIGRKLWCTELENRKDQEFLFLVLDQVMMGDSLLKEEGDLRSVAALCLRAGEGAAKSQNFQSAFVYLQHGLSLLPKNRIWSRENYELSLRLHNAAIEVCYCNANFATLDTLVIEILDHARTFEDSLLARSTQIYALGSRNKLVEAINSGLQTLAELGEKIPHCPSSRQSMVVIWKTRRLLRGLSDESLLRKPQLTNRKQLQILQVLNHLFLYAFYSQPALGAVVSARMVQITVKFGLCAMSSVAFAFYSMFLCGYGLVEEGYRYGEVSLKLYEKFKTEAWLCRIWTSFYGSVASWKMPVDQTIQPLQHAYSVGLRTGDVEQAMLANSIICWNSSEILPLPMQESQVQQATAAMELSGHTLALAMLKPQWTFVQAFMVGPSVDGKAAHEWFYDLVGRDCELAVEASNEGVLLWTRVTTMTIAYFFHDYDNAETYSRDVHKIYDKNAYCGIGSALVLLYECLVLLAQARKGFSYRWRLSYVRRRLKRLQEWGSLSPVNILSKQYLVQAELAAVRGKHKRAHADYRSAILHARNRGCLLEEALGNERFATYMLERGEVNDARLVLKEAYEAYKRWGATAKMRHLRLVYGSLLEVRES